MNTSPTAPYIMSIIASWYDTSSGGGVTDKDLYQGKCTGRSLRDLIEFIHQVDYVMSQMDESSMPNEKSMFDWFYRV